MRYRRLVLLGLLFLAVLAPLSLGGAITCFVQLRIHHHLGAGVGILLGLWALLSILLVLVGFALLIAGVFTGWRQRTGEAPFIQHTNDSA